MKDNASKGRLQLLHPKSRDRFRQLIEDAEAGLNITLRIVQGLRTFEEQQAIYNQGRTTPGKIVSMSKPGQSYHNFGLAIDLGVLDNGNIDWNFDYTKLLPYADGVTWGGNFHSIKDRPHFEITYGYSWQTLLAKYNAHDLIPGTQYVNI